MPTAPELPRVAPGMSKQLRKILSDSAVKRALEEHYAHGVRKVEKALPSLAEDEDSVTGGLILAFELGPESVTTPNGTVEIRSRAWKIRGRGKGAYEKVSGADGVFEILIRSGEDRELKSIPFQSKNKPQAPGKILTQAKKLLEHPGGALFIDYSTAPFRTAMVDDVVRDRGAIEGELGLAEVLGQKFVGCLIGDWALSYDTTRKCFVDKDGKRFASYPTKSRIRTYVNIR